MIVTKLLFDVFHVLIGLVIVEETVFVRARETQLSAILWSSRRGDFTVAIACVPCGPRRSLIYA